MNSFRCPAAMAMMLVVCSGGIAVSAAPGPQLQPLLPRFVPEIGGYAPGYGYGGVVLGPAAAVRVGPAISSKSDHLQPPTAVAGYAPSAVYKPDLSEYAAASFPQVEQLRGFNPGFRPVHTVVPKVTAVEPSVTVQKTYVDVPVVQAVQDPFPYYNYQLIDRK